MARLLLLQTLQRREPLLAEAPVLEMEREPLVALGERRGEQRGALLK